MSETVILGLITAIGTLLTTIVGGIMAYMMAKLNKKAEAAAVKTEEVKNALETSNAKLDDRLNGQTRELKDIHTLCNNQSGVTMNLLALALRRVADLTGKEPDHLAAVQAEDAYREHMKKQAVVDSRHGRTS